MKTTNETVASAATDRKFKVFGFTEDVTVCDCCGKAGLKGTFAVEIFETGELLHFGSVCVTRNTGIKNPATAAKNYHDERLKAAQVKFRQSPEYRAKEARFNLRNSMRNILPGREAMDFVRAECVAADAVIAALKVEFKLEYFWE